MLTHGAAQSARANGWRPCRTACTPQVGERGSRLSMGQRQLVALMRVLVQRPAIFILDEATASIDPFTEWQIQQALNLILQNTTSILIAHRLSTVRGGGPHHRDGERAHHPGGQSRRRC